MITYKNIKEIEKWFLSDWYSIVKIKEVKITRLSEYSIWASFDGFEWIVSEIQNKDEYGEYKQIAGMVYGLFQIGRYKIFIPQKEEKSGWNRKRNGDI
jgi:hypothetical protein